jgi:hypothetical protein
MRTGAAPSNAGGFFLCNNMSLENRKCSPSISATIPRSTTNSWVTGNCVVWLNVPSWRHNLGDTVAFADSHVEYWKWRSALPADDYFSTGSASTDPAALQDFARLQQTAPAAN